MAKFGKINQQTHQIHHKYQVSEVQGLAPTSSVITPSPEKRHHTFKQNGSKAQEN